MIVLLDPAHWVARIKAECPLYEQRVYESLTVNDGAVQLLGAPLAAVSVVEEESQPSIARDSAVQPHENRLAVKTAIPKTYNREDRLNGADALLIRQCRTELLTALLGWLPPDAKGRVEHVKAELSELNESWVWTDLFTTKDQLRNPHA